MERLPPYDSQLALKLAQGLRQRGVDPKLTAAALTQSRLRAKASAKLGPFADQLIYTDPGLQQATRLEVAVHHAARFQKAGLTRVVDLTGGIGADALAMAALGLRVTVYEQDPLTATVARANLAAFPEAQVIQADSLQANLSDADAVYADPARRTTGGRRTFDPAAYAPPLDRILELRHTHPLGIKAAPGLPHSAVPADAEAQWVSVDGDVVEVGLWFGPLRSPGEPVRSALTIRSGRAHYLAHQDLAALPTGTLAGFLYEPDGAVIRASLLEQAAAAGGLPDAALVHPRIAYITSDTELPGSPFLTGYRVLDHFPFELKRLRSYLRQRDVGTLVVKKRGTAVQPVELVKRLGLRGSASALVILTRLGAAQSVIIAQPLDSPQDH
jgi:hypothetical protein